MTGGNDGNNEGIIVFFVNAQFWGEYIFNDRKYTGEILMTDDRGNDGNNQGRVGGVESEGILV